MLFGMIYGIQELVDVNLQWIKGRITPNNFLKVVRIHQRATLHDPLHVELLHIVREFLQTATPEAVEPLITELIKQEPEWAHIIGLEHVPLHTLHTVLDNPSTDPDELCGMVCSLVDLELNKSEEELEQSPLYAGLVSPESRFREFLEELSQRVTDIGSMRMIFRVEQQLSQIMLSLSLTYQDSIYDLA